MDVLTTSLIENYLYNLSIANDGHKFRETSTILVIILTLLDRYPQFTIYLSLHKHCYLSLISSYKSQLPLLTRINTDDLSSATFFECLFKIQYFTVHGQDLLGLSKLLLKSYTGVVYLDPEDPQELLDFSHMMIIEILMHMCTELERGLPKEDSVHYTRALPENYILLYDNITVLTYILKNINPRDLDIHSFGKEFRNAFRLAIELILRSLYFILNRFYKANENRRKVDFLLEDLIRHFSKLQGSLNSLLKEQYDQSSQACFKKYLIDSGLPDKAQSSGKMTTLLKTLQSGLKNSLLSSESKMDETKASTQITEEYMKQRALSFLSEQAAVRNFNLLISKDFSLSDDQSLGQYIQTRTSSVHIMKEYYADSSQDPLVDPAVRNHELLSEAYLDSMKSLLPKSSEIVLKQSSLFTKDSHLYAPTKEHASSLLKLDLR